MSASTENRYSKSTEVPKNLQRNHEISSNHASDHTATLTPGYDRKQVVQITGNVFLILSLILHTATSSVWYRSAPLPSLYLPLPLPILLSARLELPPAVTSFYTINRLPVQRRSNPSRRQLELPPANVFQPGRATVQAPTGTSTSRRLTT